MTTATKLDVWDANAVLSRRRDALRSQLDGLEHAVDVLTISGNHDDEAAVRLMRWADIVQTASVALDGEGIHEAGLSVEVAE